MKKLKNVVHLYDLQNYIDLFDVQVYRKEASERIYYEVVLEDVSTGDYDSSAVMQFNDLESALAYALALLKEWRRK